MNSYADLPYHFLPRDIDHHHDMSSFLLALAAHAILFLLLFFGINWQSQEPAVIEAELWSALPQTAAPLPSAPPRVIPKPAPVVKEEAEPTPDKPDIAIKAPIERQPQKKVEPPKPLPKVEVKPDPVKPPSDLAYLQQLASTPSNGTSAQTSGPSDHTNYAGKIKRKILSNLRFPIPTDLVGNPEAEFLIEQLPSGEITSVKKLRASGLAAYDAAVERAIEASSPLPKDDNGKVEAQLRLIFNPLEKR